MMSNNTISIISYNVRGLKEEKKRWAVFHWLRKQKCDIVMLQETHCHLKKDENLWSREWAGQSIWSRGTGKSKGVAVLFNRNTKYNYIDVVKDFNGRYIRFKLEHDKSKFNIINIYAPNGEYERVHFFNSMNGWINDDEGYETIIGGDFNCVLKNKLDRYNCNEKIDVGQIDLKQLMNSFNLEEIWRRRNPTKREFSWEGRGKKSRIDYWIVSKSLDNQINKIEYKIGPFSDHKAIFIDFRTSETQRGKGLWKMNVSVIKSKLFQESLKAMWNNWKKRKNEYQDLRVWWDIGKKHIKELSVWVSKKISTEQNKDIINLEKQLQYLEKNSASDTYIKECKNKLEQFYKEKAEGAKIRSRSTWWEEGEKSTKYFHGLEKKNGKEQMWDSILTPEGIKVKGLKNIQSEQLQFYENLYTAQECKNDMYDSEFLDILDKKLSTDSKTLLDSNISLKELSNALFKMQNNKSPGGDGICVEFYKMYWADIKHDFFQIAMLGLNEEKLAYTQYLAVIKLLYKKGVREDIKNWRPISLLNVDFKIISKTLAERLIKVMPEIIHTDQKGCVKGRYIGENVRLVEDILESHDDDSLILLLDQEKAFDRVEWSWLCKVLKQFNFGERFITWILTLYNGAKSSLLTNGYHSKYFKITRGIRQGDAMSALLYIIQSEPLAQKLRMCDDIEGITLNIDGQSKVCRVIQYVDDTIVFLKHARYIEPCMKIIEKFEVASGSKLNKSKTKALSLNNAQGNEDPISGIQITSGPEMILGIPVGKNNSFDEYWDKLIKKMKVKLDMWAFRDLSFDGKVHLIKSIGLSSILYAIEMKTIKSVHIKLVNDILWNFLWSDKRYNIKKEVCTLPRSLGGLGMVDLSTVIKVKRIKWVIRILKGKTNDSWKIIPMSHFKCLDTDFGIRLFNLRTTDTSDLLKKKNIPNFYRECILNFQELSRKAEISDGNNILWGSHKLRFNGKPFFLKHWSQCGVKSVSDIVENAVFKEQDVYTKLVHKAGYIFEMFTIKSCMPKEWMENAVSNQSNDETFNENVEEKILNKIFRLPNGKKKALCELSSKDLYNILLLNNQVTITSKKYWLQKFPDYNIDWNQWFSYNFVNILIPRKCKDFNWRIFHGLVNTEARLKKMKYSNGICTLCKADIENLDHLLYDCDELHDIWFQIEQLIQSVIPDFAICNFYSLAGYMVDNCNSNIINSILTISRWCLWKRRNLFKYESELITGINLWKWIKKELKKHIKCLLNNPKTQKDIINSLYEAL
jgi:exonuclease III